MESPVPLRMQIISPDVIRHVMEYPARGRAWTLRELAGVLGCHNATLNHMRTGRSQTVSTELARRFSEAVGVEMPVLFRSAMSTESDTEAGAA